MHAPAETAASWPEDIFKVLQRFDVRQVPYVPDAGHSQLIDRVLGAPSMRAVPLTTEEEGVALVARDEIVFLRDHVGLDERGAAVVAAHDAAGFQLIERAADRGERRTKTSREAVQVRGGTKLLAVTVLTSMDETDLAELGWRGGPVEELVSLRARAAVAAGIDGLICSAQEAARLRRELGPGPLLITPGIRAASERGGDDQKRTMTLEEAFRAGADHIVVGRPIRKATDPRAAAEAIQAEIAAIFAE